MSKRTIAQWWIWGLAAFLPAGVLIPSSAVALAMHLEQFPAESGAALAADRYAMTMATLIGVGALSAVGGVIAQFVSWIEALRNTRRLPDPRWYNALLWGGIAGIATTPLFGLGALILGSAMLAYLVAGPDATKAEPRPTTPGKTTIMSWTGKGFAVAGGGLAVWIVTSGLTGYGRLLHGVVWPSLAVISAAVSAIMVGGVIVAAAWWGSLFNARSLPDQTWFTRLLWIGALAMLTMPLLGLGAVILAILMATYGHSAPDGFSAEPAHSAAPGRSLVRQ